MSREVRRVPIDYKHDYTINPYWEQHEKWLSDKLDGKSIPNNGIPRNCRFEPLFDGTSFKQDLKKIEKEIDELKNKTGFHWNFEYDCVFKGYHSNHYDKWIEPSFKYIDLDEFGDEDYVDVKDEDHLLELMIAKKERELLKMEDSLFKYTPVPDVDADTDGFGYCLYETVSEGTPVTPVFENPEEIVEYLVNVGTFNGETYSRKNAEVLVGTGYSFGSFAVVDGQMYNSSTQAAELDEAFGKID